MFPHLRPVFADLRDEGVGVSREFIFEEGEGASEDQFRGVIEWGCHSFSSSHRKGMEDDDGGGGGDFNRGEERGGRRRGWEGGYSMVG